MRSRLALPSDDSDDETSVVRAEKKQQRGGLVAKVCLVGVCPALLFDVLSTMY